MRNSTWGRRMAIKTVSNCRFELLRLLQNLDCRCRSECSRLTPGAKYPYDLLCRRHFDGLNRRIGEIHGTCPLVEPLIDQRISIGETRGCLHVGEFVWGGIRGGELP